MGFLRNLFGGLFASSGKGENNVERTLKEVFSEGYRIESNVDVRTLCPEYSNRYSFSFVMYDQVGNVRLVVELLPHNGQNDHWYKEAIVALEKRNIKHVHFFTQFPNEREYVINRIRKAL